MATKTEEKTATDKLTAARNKNLDLAIQQIAKDYGEGAIMRLGDEKIVDIDVIPTGNILIDRALGVGGFRRRKSAAALQPLSTSSTRSILRTRKGLALILTICWSLSPVPARKRCGFARRWCAPML